VSTERPFRRTDGQFDKPQTPHIIIEEGLQAPQQIMLAGPLRYYSLFGAPVARRALLADARKVRELRDAGKWTRNANDFREMRCEIMRRAKFKPSYYILLHFSFFFDEQFCLKDKLESLGTRIGIISNAILRKNFTA